MDRTLPAPRLITLQMALGLYSALTGVQMLVAPYRFGGPLHAVWSSSLAGWGLLTLAGGAALLVQTALEHRQAPEEPLPISPHLLSGLVLLLYAGAMTASGSWFLVAFTLAFGLAVLSVPVLAGQGRPDSDLFAGAAGLGFLASGGAALLAPHRFTAPQFEILQGNLGWCGVSLLVSGLGLLACQTGRLPRPAVIASHTFAGVSMAGWLLPVHAAIGNANGLAFYSWTSLLLVSLPWLGPALDRLDRQSLVTRLAFTVCALATAPIVLALVVLTAPESLEWAAEEGALPHRPARDLASATVVAGMGAAAGAGAILARWLTEPLQRLAAATRAIATGDETAVLPHSAITELSTLTSELAAMRRKLLDRETELRRMLDTSGKVEALLEAEREVLAQGAQRMPLYEALARLCQSIESLCADGVLASILRVDGPVLRHAAAPGLPEPYRRAIDGQAWGEGRGSCGTAVARRAPVLVADIASDPLWEGLQELALPYGLRACWSVPVFAADGRVLATFALYYREVRAPTDAHLQLVSLVGRTVSAVLERAAAEEERARLLRDLSESQARYRHLFTSTAEAILILDADGHYLDANQAACDLSGYTREELLQLRVGGLSPHPEQVVAVWSERVSGSAWQGESELRSKDGAIIPVLALLTPVELPTGKIFISALRDISERRAVEQMQREFIAVVGHELRNPLAAIHGFASMLRLKREHDDRSLERIIAQTRQLDRLVGDLLDTYQLEAGRLMLRVRKVDLNEVVRAAVEEAGRVAQHTLYVRCPDEPTVGWWDPDRLSQVLRNLLSNAIKYAPPGTEISVLVEPEPLCVSVTDQGPGIPEEARQRIFERFYRTQAARQETGGLGVGLYVCRELVVAHGGSIDVRSEPGRGSTFSFRLPHGQPPA